MIVATKRATNLNRNRVRFVNLLRNPDDPVEAMTLTRKLLAMDESVISLVPRPIDIGGNNWGSVMAVPQKEITDKVWSYTALAQADLVLAVGSSGESRPLSGVPLAELSKLADLGPYEMQIKNPRQGLFTIVETGRSPKGRNSGIVAPEIRSKYHSGGKS